MEQLRIFIVEDEVIIAEDLKNKLQDIGYAICGMAYNFEEAKLQLEKTKPDLALIDIQLSDIKDGIDLATYIKEQLQIPFLFVTSNADSHTISRAKETNPSGYIIKPFSKRELYASIEIAINSKPNVTQESREAVQENPLFVKESHRYTQIQKEDIRWLKAEANYTKIQTEKSQHLVRGKLKAVLEHLPCNFIRVHKSYAVNLNLVGIVQHSYVQIDEKQIPIGDSYRSQLFQKMTLL